MKDRGPDWAAIGSLLAIVAFFCLAIFNLARYCFNPGFTPH